MLLLILPSAPIQGQFRLVVGQPIFSDYPEIQIPFEILDNSALLDTITSDDFILWENGIRMLPLEVDCGDLQAAQKIHFFFLMDVSYSMAFKEGTNSYDRDSVKWRGAKNVFVQAFNKLRPQDEGALASFAADFLVEQQFTLDKKLLIDANAGMKLRSGTAIYDAVVTASAYLEQKQGKKIIILLTDGVDNQSHNLREQAINIAWSRGVPVYPIGLGFYPDANNPGRVDQDTLRRIATGTGGKAFFAPTSEDLSKIFDEIMEGIYSIGCVLRYNTIDTCQDGSSRNIKVSADVRGVILEEEFSYTLPDLRSRLHLSLSLPAATLLAGDTYTIPVMANGEVRAGEPMSFEAILRYDPTALEIQQIAAGLSVIDPSQIIMTEPILGELHFTVNNSVPLRGVSYGNPDELFSLVAYVFNRNSIITTSFGVEFVWAQQVCDMVPTALGTSIIIHGCPAIVEIGFDTTIVAQPGAMVDVPILMPSDIDLAQALRYEMWIDFDNALFTYQGFSLEGSISQNLDVAVTVIGSTLHITAAEGMPRDSSDVLIYLHFRAAELKAARPVSFRLRDVSLSQTAIGIAVSICRPDIELYGAVLYADGICQPLVRRKAGPILEQNRPNPVTGSNSHTTIGFTTTGTATVHLEILDEFGRTQDVLVEGLLEAGHHTVVWRPGNLPSGVYLCVLREGGDIRTQKILLTR